MRGELPFMDGIWDGLHEAFRYPEWMEITSILSTIALWVIALTLIALAVRTYLNARKAYDELVGSRAPREPERPPVAVVEPASPGTQEAPTEPMPQGPPPVAPQGETPRQVLDRRYAEGEIDRDEYLSRREDLD